MKSLQCDSGNNNVLNAATRICSNTAAINMAETTEGGTILVAAEEAGESKQNTSPSFSASHIIVR